MRRYVNGDKGCKIADLIERKRRKNKRWETLKEQGNIISINISENTNANTNTNITR